MEVSGGQCWPFMMKNIFLIDLSIRLLYPFGVWKLAGDFDHLQIHCELCPHKTLTQCSNVENAKFHYGPFSHECQTHTAQATLYPPRFGRKQEDALR